MAHDEGAGRGGAPADQPGGASVARVPDEYHDAIDDALQLLYAQYYRIASQLFTSPPPRLTLAELYASPVADLLVQLAQIAVGAVEAEREEVLAAIDTAVELLFMPAGATSYLLDRSFWEERPLGRMLAQAKFRTFARQELMTIGDAAHTLRVARPTIYRWIDERRLDSVRDGLSGRTFVVRKDVEAQLAGSAE